MKTPDLTIYRRKLPHWRIDGSTYFVTWRLAGRQRALSGHERTTVADAIKRFAGERYDLVAYVVMDDHVHALITPIGEFELQEIVHSWKSFTANRIQKNSARIGAIWQDEYFDRIVRDETEMLEKINYILGNPTKKWPELEEYAWVECDLSV